jgi:hypothetical protein
MTTIYISYASDDTEFGRRLKKSLENLGYSVLSVTEELSPGEDWQDAFVEKLKDADAIVVVVSPVYKKKDWIRYEVPAAVAYARERGSPLVIPVLLGDVDPPPFIAPFAGIHVSNNDAEDSAEKIAQSLGRQVGIRRAKVERQQEYQLQVESSAANYIKKSLEQLEARESTYQTLAYLWYGLAYFTLLATVGFGVWRVLVTGPSTTTWPALVELAVIGVIVVGLLVALAKYAFSLGKSFMVEALRNADRRHAISYGEFYLRARGASIDWDEVKDAFQHWNIDKGSQFIRQQATDLDPQVFALVRDIVQALVTRERGSRDKGS